MKRIFLLILTLTGAFAMAEGPCAKDRETLCAGVSHGDGRMMKCMKENEAKLSPECKASWAKNMENMKELKAACHDDAETLCAGKTHRDLAKCMRQNKEKLSEGCKAEWKEMKESRKGRKG